MKAKLSRTLGLAECVFFGVGSILGAGIYTLIGKVVGHGGMMTWLSFAIAGMAALFTVFSYAELSAMFPKAGGEYVYGKIALGPKIAFFLGSVVIFNGIVTGAAVSLGFAGYMSQLFQFPMHLVALGILLLIFIINAVGIRQASLFNIVLTVIEFSGLIFVIVVCLMHVKPVSYFELPPEGFHGILLGSALSFFAYIGFEEIVKLAEETRDPKKNIPRALFISSAIVLVMYLLISLAVLMVMPWQDLAKSDSPLAAVVNTGIGKTGMMVVSVIALFATANTILSNMLGASRVVFSISQTHPILKRFATTSATRKTPVSALIAIAVLMGLFTLIGKIEIVALIANVFICTTFILINFSVIFLRLRNADLPRPYRIPYAIRKVPVFPVMGILITAILLGYDIYGLFLV